MCFYFIVTRHKAYRIIYPTYGYCYIATPHVPRHRQLFVASTRSSKPLHSFPVFVQGAVFGGSHGSPRGAKTERCKSFILQILSPSKTLDTFFFLCLHPFVMQRIREAVNAQLLNIFLSLKKKVEVTLFCCSFVFAKTLQWSVRMKTCSE